MPHHEQNALEGFFGARDASMAMDPLTDKGSKIMSSMKKEYGEKKGKSVFYASKNKGKITGVDDMPGSMSGIATSPSLGIPAGLTTGISKDAGNPLKGQSSASLKNPNTGKAVAAPSSISTASSSASAPKINTTATNRFGGKKPAQVRAAGAPTMPSWYDPNAGAKKAKQPKTKVSTGGEKPKQSSGSTGSGAYKVGHAIGSTARTAISTVKTGAVSGVKGVLAGLSKDCDSIPGTEYGKRGNEFGVGHANAKVSPQLKKAALLGKDGEAKSMPHALTTGGMDDMKHPKNCECKDCMAKREASAKDEWSDAAREAAITKEKRSGKQEE